MPTTKKTKKHGGSAKFKDLNAIQAAWFQLLNEKWASVPEDDPWKKSMSGHRGKGGVRANKLIGNDAEFEKLLITGQTRLTLQAWLYDGDYFRQVRDELLPLHRAALLG